MSTKAKQINFSEKEIAAINALKNAGRNLTLAEICTEAGMEIKSGSIVSAMNKGCIEARGEIVTEKPGKRAVSTYAFVTMAPGKNAEGKDCNYSDTEKDILGVLSASPDAEMTLAEISEKLDRAIASGSITSLIKKGNVQKTGSKYIECMVKGKVKTYGYVCDPSDVNVEA